MKPHLVFAVLSSLALLVALGAQVSAGGDEETVCVERPITFDPMFRPSGCFTYEPIDGGIVVIGRSLLDTNFVPSGRTVEARVGGATCGETTAGQDGLYVLPVAGGDTRAGCPRQGDRLEFYLDGVQANQTLAWPEDPGDSVMFLALTSVPSDAWFWFERVANPPARAGMRIEAITGGQVCDSTSLGDERSAFDGHNRPGLRGFMRLIISRDGLCGVEGSDIEFRVNGLRGATVRPWEPGVQRINLLVQGDATCDFALDSRDATLILQVVSALSASVRCHGDADLDDDVDAIDARHILEYAAGITDALPVVVPA